MTAGRPSIVYSSEVAREVCSIIESCPKTLTQICEANPHLPKSTTLYKWLASSQEFTDWYLESKRKQVHIYVEECFELSSYCDSEPGSVAKCNMEVNLRKWYASRLIPRLYGEKTETKSDMNINLHEQNLKHLK